MGILDKILSPVNRAIDNMPRKTVTSIRQVFIFVVVIACILGMVYGIVKGKAAAPKTGIRLFNSTDDAFEIDARRERGDDPAFSGVGEAEFLSERKTGDYPKDEAPVNERLAPENREFVVEADRDVKVKEPFDSSINPQRLAEIPHMDNTKVESEVTRIERERAVSETKPRIIQNQTIEPVKAQALPSKSEKTRERGGASQKDIRDLSPIKDTEHVVE